MTNVAEAPQTAEALAQSAMEHLTLSLKQEQGSELTAKVLHNIEVASGHLEDALKRIPDSVAIGSEHGHRIALGIYNKLANGEAIDPEIVEGMVKSVSDTLTKKANMFTKLTDAFTKNKVGALIVKHPEKAAGITGLLTLVAAWVLPNKKEQTQAGDGSVQESEKWGPMKATAVAVGSVVSAGLLAHYAHGKWATKVAAETAQAFARI